MLALVFDFLNGIHDSSNVVATMISSRALPPRVALGMTAVAEFLGPFIFGVAVAETIGGIVDSNAISLQVLIAALFSAIFGICSPGIWDSRAVPPTRLIGGLIGAVIIGAGWQAINLDELKKILIALFTSPFIGFHFRLHHPQADPVALLECIPAD